MDRLVDLIGYVGILLHGLVIVSQSMALGGMLFLVLLARPFATQLGPVVDRTVAIAAWSAVALVGVEALGVALQIAVLVSTVDLPVGNVLRAHFAVAGIVKTLAAGALAGLLWRNAAAGWLLGAGGVELAAATLTTHAAARLSDNGLLLGVEALHQLGAAIWIGGIPCFVMALAGLKDGGALRLVGGRFSRMSMAGVACILASGVTMSVFYIGSWAGLYGTAYGVMVGAKIGMFTMLLGLGLANFLVTERMRRDPATPVLRLRRFAEVEIGIGFTVFFAAASLTSVPPAIDLTADRATWHEIVARDLSPRLPTLVSPDHARLGIPALQAQLDAEARARAAEPRAAFVEGSGELPPRNADDIAWSEYNHHWAGLFVLAIGLLALVNQAGVNQAGVNQAGVNQAGVNQAGVNQAGVNQAVVRWARHWPLVFLGLSAFLFLRSDPEVWPLGSIGLIDSLRDAEVVQHRLFALMPLLFGVFEWCVRTGRLRSRAAAQVFPLVCAGGGALLLTHNHTIANVKDALLIEFTHTPLALTSIVAGWARWLEIRLPAGRGAMVAGWVWPWCFVAIGLLLVFYREA